MEKVLPVPGVTIIPGVKPSLHIFGGATSARIKNLQ